MDEYPDGTKNAEVVEVGRHASLRGWWVQARVGSNPAFGTIEQSGSNRLGDIL